MWIFLWKDERLRLLAGSPGASMPPSYSPGPSTLSSYSPGSSTPSHGNPECSACRLLDGKIKVLETTLEMYMHPQNHTLHSTVLLHEVYSDMGKLRLE